MMGVRLLLFGVRSSSSTKTMNDCDVNAVPASGVLRAEVSRASVSGTSAGVWCPLNQIYVGNTNMSGGGEFGAQYVFDHNQAVGYTTSVPKYTEFIEVAIEQPVFVSLVELGSPRGMGMVVSIKAYNPTTGWTTLYSSSALTTEAAQYTSASRYWSWQPDLCRAHFNVTDLRIEIDTSSETVRFIEERRCGAASRATGRGRPSPSARPHAEP